LGLDKKVERRLSFYSLRYLFILIPVVAVLIILLIASLI